MTTAIKGLRPLALTGGESVYCINEAQQERAHAILAQAREESEFRLLLDAVKTRLDRNQQAALAFLVLESLRQA